MEAVGQKGLHHEAESVVGGSFGCSGLDFKAVLREACERRKDLVVFHLPGQVTSCITFESER